MRSGEAFILIYYMKARLTIYLTMCILALLTVSCGADHYMKKGEKFLAIGEYYDAAAEFKTAYNKTPTKERENADNAHANLPIVMTA